MLSLTDLLNTPIIQSLGQTLMHFLWQGALLAIIIATLLNTLKSSSARLRYTLSFTGLIIMLVLPIITFVYLNQTATPSYRFVEETQPISQTNQANAEPLATATQTQEVNQAQNIAPPAQTTTNTLNTTALQNKQNYIPYLVMLWLIGVIVLSVRLIGGLIFTQKLRQKHTRKVSEQLEQTLKQLSQKLSIKQTVQLRESLAINVPLVVGWLKPIILLPTSTLTGLTQNQIEMILAHELAHIKRNDYLANLLQSIAETLLFYHPAIWWLSSVIRQERENCCDDLAVNLSQNNKLAYAKTLAQLDNLKPSSQAALAATGGTLLKRIQRLAGKTQDNNNPAQWLIGLSLIVIPYLVLSVATAQAKLPLQIEQNIDNFVNSRLDTWQVPGMQVAVIQDGQVTFNKAYGVADLETNRAMTIDTPIQLGSGSWLVNAIATMQLVDQGKLDLEDTIADHLPWLEFKEGEENEITLYQLILGNSNIADSVRIEGAQVVRATAQLSLNEVFNSKEAYLRSLRPEQLYTSRKGDSDYRYIHNDVILSLILENVSGLSLPSFVQSNIFLPLGINASYHPDQISNLAKLYEPTELNYVANEARIMQQVILQEAAVLNNIFNLSMSSRDFTKLLSSVVNQEATILSKDAWAALLKSRQRIWGAGGWWYRSISGQPTVANIGATEGSQLLFEIMPEANIAYLTMSNYYIPTDRNPIYEVLGSVSMSLMMLNEDIPFTSLNPLSEDQLKEPRESTINRLKGRHYISALGPITITQDNKGLKGTFMGHEITLKRFSGSLVIQSSYEALQNIPLSVTPDGINIWGRQFAYPIN